MNKQVPSTLGLLCLPWGLHCLHSWVPWYPPWATLALLVSVGLLERNRACPLPLPARCLTPLRWGMHPDTGNLLCSGSQASVSHHMLLPLHLDLPEILASNRTLILFSVQPPTRSHEHWGSWSHPALRQTLISPSQTYGAMLKNEQGARLWPKRWPER